MRSTTLVGWLLVAMGVIAFAFGAIPLQREQHKAELGPLRVSVEERRAIPLLPVVGAVALVGGLALLLAGSRQET